MEKHPDALRRSFEHHFGGVRKATGLDAQQILEHERHVVGTGVISFVGATPIQALVRITNDANDRCNPRAVVPEHMDRLADSINRGKHDWNSPLVVEAPRALISQQLQDDMKSTPAFQLVSLYHDLTLNNITSEEMKISNEIIWCREVGAPAHVFLTDDEILDRRNRLHQLRAARPMCRLMNGNHRLHVCIERAKKLYNPLLEQVTNLQKRFFRDGEAGCEQEMKEKAEVLRKVAGEQTWKVLVIAGGLLEDL